MKTPNNLDTDRIPNDQIFAKYRSLSNASGYDKRVYVLYTPHKKAIILSLNKIKKTILERKVKEYYFRI